MSDNVYVSKKLYCKTAEEVMFWARQEGLITNERSVNFAFLLRQYIVFLKKGGRL